MAWHRERYRISGAGSRHRADGRWLPHHLGQLPISPGFAGRYLAEGLPDPLLKRRPAQIKRQIKRHPGLDHETQNGLDGFGKPGIAFLNGGAGKAPAEIAH